MLHTKHVKDYVSQSNMPFLTNTIKTRYVIQDYLFINIKEKPEMIKNVKKKERVRHLPDSSL